MAELVWDEVGTRFYENGADRGVLYPLGTDGVAWNGLISVQENISGGETEEYFFDGVKYLDIVAYQNYQAVVEAFSAPKEFSSFEGNWTLAMGLLATGQVRETFGFSYRTMIGNDIDGPDHGYKIHLVYGATAAPRARSDQTVNEDVDPDTLQWTINTVPPRAGVWRPTAHLIVDSTDTDPVKLALLETHLYGTEDSVPYLPDQMFVIDLLGLPADQLPDDGDPTNEDQEVIDGGDPADSLGGTVDGGGNVDDDIIDGGGP